MFLEIKLVIYMYNILFKMNAKKKNTSEDL